jgi:hypothetical protein
MPGPNEEEDELGFVAEEEEDALGFVAEGDDFEAGAAEWGQAMNDEVDSDVRVHGLVFDPINIVAGETPRGEVTAHEGDFTVGAYDDEMPTQDQIDEHGRRETFEGWRDALVPNDAATGHLTYPLRAAADLAYETWEHPEDTAIGAAQGFMSDTFDEIGGGFASQMLANPQGMAGLGGGISPDFDGLPEGMPNQGAMTESLREADQTAANRSPTAHSMGYGAGALGQAAALPISTARLPWYLRPAAEAGIGSVQAAAQGAGATDYGPRGEGAMQAMPMGAAFGLGGGLLGTGADLALRAPGATSGMADTMSQHADQMRLSASGVGHRPALNAADQAFGGTMRGRRVLAGRLREHGLGEVGGIPMPGRALDDAFALRQEVGPEIGNPLRPRLRQGTMEESALGLSPFEQEMDSLGAYVNMDEVADEIAQSATHEAGDVGSATQAVQQFADRFRGRGPIRFSAAHRQRQQLQRAMRDGGGPDFAGVPEAYLTQAQSIINRRMQEALETVDSRRVGASRMDMGRVADQMRQDLLREGFDPQQVSQVINDLLAEGTEMSHATGPAVREGVGVERPPGRRARMLQADQAPDPMGRTQALPPPRLQVTPEQPTILPREQWNPETDSILGELGISPQDAEYPTPGVRYGDSAPARYDAPPVATPPDMQRPQPETGGTPYGAPVDPGRTAPRPGRRAPMAQAPVDPGATGQATQIPPERPRLGTGSQPQAAAPVDPGGTVPRAGRRRPPPVEAPPVEPPQSMGPVFGGAAATDLPMVDVDGPMLGPVGPPEHMTAMGGPQRPPRVPLPDSLIERGRSAVDQEMQRAAGTAGTGPGYADHWRGLNEDYSLGAHVLQHGPYGQGASVGMEIGEGNAVRQALGGDPTALARLHATRAATGLVRDVGRGAYTRLAEGAATGMTNIAERLSSVAASHPERLGPYAVEIARVARQGSQAMAAYHYQHAMSDPDYRAMLEENGLGMEDTGEDPAVYDTLTEGLTEGEF